MKGVITISAVNLLKWNIPPWKDLNCWTKEELRNQCFFSHLPLNLTSDYKSRFGVCASKCGCHTEKHYTLSSDDSVFHYFKIVSPKAGMYQQKWKRKNENKEDCLSQILLYTFRKAGLHSEHHSRCFTYVCYTISHSSQKHRSKYLVPHIFLHSCT